MEAVNSNENNSPVLDIEDFTKIRAEISKVLNDNKTEDVLEMNLKDRFQYDFWFILGTALSSTHLKKLSQEVIRLLKSYGIHAAHVPGDADYASGWVALDYGEVIVHLLLRDKREFYDLENL